MIGLAAAVIAYAGHRRSERERDANEGRLKRAEAAQLAHAALSITQARGLLNTVERFMSMSDAKKDVRALSFVAENIASRSGAIILSEQEISVLPSSAVVCISDINDSLELIRATCAQLLKTLRAKASKGMNNAPLDAWETEGLDILFSSASSIAEVGARYLAAIYPEER